MSTHTHSHAHIVVVVVVDTRNERVCLLTVNS